VTLSLWLGGVIAEEDCGAVCLVVGGVMVTKASVVGSMI
jgi:hypothetical protein